MNAIQSLPRKIVIAGMGLMALLCTACRKNIPEPSRAFYYWQSDFTLSDGERQSLQSLHIQQLYIKFFDISWNAEAAQPVPAATLHFSDPLPGNIRVVPVIFIANEALLHISDSAVNTLAFKAAKKLSDMLQSSSMAAPAEIQLDCDWSISTRDKYFQLIRQMQQFPGFEKIQWSATIRLHQVKFSDKTGVPPVSRGMLMFYNMGDIEDRQSANSIFDAHVAEQFTPYLNSYPLPLDVAIACFSWGLLFEHEKLYQIYYPLYTEDLERDSLFTKVSAQRFVADHPGYFRGAFLNTGDEIKLETMSPQLSDQSAVLLNAHLKNQPGSVILYHLDSVILNRFTYDDFERIYHRFD